MIRRALRWMFISGLGDKLGFCKILKFRDTCQYLAIEFLLCWSAPTSCSWRPRSIPYGGATVECLIKGIDISLLLNEIWLGERQE